MTCRYCVLAVMFLSALTSFGCARGNATNAQTESSAVLEVETVQVQRSQIRSSLELVGNLIPLRFTNIVSEVDGVIKRIPKYEKEVQYEIGGQKYSQPVYLDIGHPVKKGEVLVEIDPVDFQLAWKAAQARLQLAQKELEKLRAWKRPEEVDQLKAQREEAIAVLNQCRAALDRSKQLLPQRAVSREEYERCLMSFRAAEATKKRVEAALKLSEAGPTEEEIAVAEAKVAMAEADVALQAENVAECTIRSPYDAVIVDRYMSEGDRVAATPSAVIMQILDPSILFAQVGVPEKYEGKVDINDVAEVYSSDGVTRVPGVVGLVNEKSDPETHTFRVRVGIDNRKGLFKPGTFVNVKLQIDAAADALVAPTEAMTFTEGRTAVFVYKDGHVEERPVTVGISNRTHYEIISGLSEGEQVAVGNTAVLSDGLPVRLKTVGSSASGGN